MDEEVIAYVRKVLAAGHDVEKVKETLIHAGHDPEKVEIHVNFVIETHEHPEPADMKTKVRNISIGLTVILVALMIFFQFQDDETQTLNELLIKEKIVQYRQMLQGPVAVTGQHVLGLAQTEMYECDQGYCVDVLDDVKQEKVVLAFSEQLPDQVSGERIDAGCIIKGEYCKVQHLAKTVVGEIIMEDADI